MRGGVPTALSSWHLRCDSRLVICRVKQSHRDNHAGDPTGPPPGLRRKKPRHAPRGRSPGAELRLEVSPCRALWRELAWLPYAPSPAQRKFFLCKEIPIKALKCKCPRHLQAVTKVTQVVTWHPPKILDWGSLSGLPISTKSSWVGLTTIRWPLPSPSSAPRPCPRRVPRPWLAHSSLCGFPEVAENPGVKVACRSQRGGSRRNTSLVPG